MRSCLKYFVLIFCLNFIEGSQLLGCGYKYDSDAKGWFKHVSEPATWYNARKHCAQEGAVLASPTENEIDNGIVNIIKALGKEEDYDIFIGYYANASDPAFRDVDGTLVTFLEWDPNDPGNEGLKDMCVKYIINNDYDYGTYDAALCNETFPYICYHSASTEGKVNECGTVDPEYHLDNRTNKCYKFHNVTRNFSQAVLKCTAEGGHLAIINSDTEAIVLGEIISQHPDETLVGTRWKQLAFIGIHNFDKKRDWRTIHGQTLEEAGYARFSPGEPNNAGHGQYCGSINRNGLIDDIFCDEPAVFICEKIPDYNADCSLPDETAVGFYKSGQL